MCEKHELVDVSQSRLGRLQSETEADETLQKNKTYVWSGWPTSIKSLDPELCPFWGVHKDISIVDDLVMTGSCIIISQSSRQAVLREIHEGNQGKTNARAEGQERCLLAWHICVCYSTFFE